MFPNDETEVASPPETGPTTGLMGDELGVPDYAGLDDSGVGIPDYAAAGEDGGIIDLDLTDMKDPFEPAPHGNYRFRIKKYELGVSKEAKNPMISAEVDIIGATSENMDHVGKTVFDNMVLSGKGEKFGRWRHRQISLAVGLPISGGVPASAYIGKEFDGELAVDPGDETHRAKNVFKNVFVG